MNTTKGQYHHRRRHHSNSSSIRRNLRVLNKIIKLKPVPLCTIKENTAISGIFWFCATQDEYCIPCVQYKMCDIVCNKCENKAEVKDDFKSLDPRIKTAKELLVVVGEALTWQELFTRKTPPWEMVEWETDELKCYEVHANRVDRVYHIYVDDGDGVGHRRYILLGRMRYGSRMSYFALEAGCDFCGFICEGGGEIYVTFDAQIFLKSVVRPSQNPHAIWTLMLEDGLKVHEPSPFDLLPVRRWKGVPMLKYLCHQTVCKHRDILADEAARVLPKLLADSVGEFIRTRSSREHYESEGEYESESESEGEYESESD